MPAAHALQIKMHHYLTIYVTIIFKAKIFGKRTGHREKDENFAFCLCKIGKMFPGKWPKQSLVTRRAVCRAVNASVICRRSRPFQNCAAKCHKKRCHLGCCQRDPPVILRWQMTSVTNDKTSNTNQDVFSCSTGRVASIP